jgi:hypothetical protein
VLDPPKRYAAFRHGSKIISIPFWLVSQTNREKSQDITPPYAQSSLFYLRMRPYFLLISHLATKNKEKKYKP